MTECQRCLNLEGKLRAAEEEIRALRTELEFAEIRRINSEEAQVRAFGDSIEKAS